MTSRPGDRTAASPTSGLATRTVVAALLPSVLERYHSNPAPVIRLIELAVPAPLRYGPHLPSHPIAAL